MWSFMIKHVLVAKDLWNIVNGNEPRLVRQASPSTSDVTSSGSSRDAFVPPTQEIIQWDGRDAKAQVIIALFVKRTIVSHIRSCTIAKESWDKLASLYQVHNDARIAYFAGS